MKQYFVTSIHTDGGKTFISSLLVKGLSAYYWKPIQSGIEIRDTETVAELSGIAPDKLLKEAYLLHSPESPHSAAAKDGVTIDLEQVTLPKVEGNLIVEGAGGILVPINDEQTILDVIKKLDLPVLLVVPTYLGCINHSLLTISELKRHRVELAGIIFNGDESLEAQKIIAQRSGVERIIRVPKLNVENRSELDYWAIELNKIF